MFQTFIIHPQFSKIQQFSKSLFNFLSNPSQIFFKNSSIFLISFQIFSNPSYHLLFLRCITKLSDLTSLHLFQLKISSFSYHDFIFFHQSYLYGISLSKFSKSLPSSYKYTFSHPLLSTIRICLFSSLFPFLSFA